MIFWGAEGAQEECGCGQGRLTGEVSEECKGLIKEWWQILCVGALDHVIRISWWSISVEKEGVFDKTAASQNKLVFFCTS